MNLTPEAIQKLKTALPSMPEKEKRRVADLLKRYQTEKTKQLGRDSFLDFIAHVYPGYKVGPHHRKLAKIFDIEDALSMYRRRGLEVVEMPRSEYEDLQALRRSLSRLVGSASRPLEGSASSLASPPLQATEFPARQHSTLKFARKFILNNPRRSARRITPVRNASVYANKTKLAS